MTLNELRALRAIGGLADEAVDRIEELEEKVDELETEIQDLERQVREALEEKGA